MTSVDQLQDTTKLHNLDYHNTEGIIKILEAYGLVVMMSLTT